MRRCVYPRRGRGLTEGVTACAVGAGAHIDGASRCPMRPPLSLRADGVTRSNAPLAHTDEWRTMWMRNPMGDGGRCGEATAEGRLYNRSPRLACLPGASC